jgi:phosphoribosylformylglycinamidine cyclo-ligase
MFDVPPLFELIQRDSKTEWNEMYKVFNMGHRMELYIPETISNEIISLANSFNVDAQVIGHCHYYKGKKVRIISKKGDFIYQ